MKNTKHKIKIILFSTVVSISLGLGTNAIVKAAKAPVKKPVAVQKYVAPPAPKTCDSSYETVSSLAVVANPGKYLNKRIKIRAKFDKFSALGLDYKPAYKSSEKYITFLIKRDDVTDHTIPLSEMKNFLARNEAEKYIDLKTGDEIEYCGTVFSNALGDVWVDVERFTVISQQSKDKNPTKK